jgi:hypothetical protein
LGAPQRQDFILGGAYVSSTSPISSIFESLQQQVKRSLVALLFERGVSRTYSLAADFWPPASLQQ